MNYRTLFDIEPDGTLTATIARYSDPITSHQSAAETDLPKYQQQALQALKTMDEPATAREVAKVAERLFHGMNDTYRKRVLDLVRNGKAEECGERPCQITGKNAQTFRARTSK